MIDFSSFTDPRPAGQAICRQFLSTEAENYAPQGYDGVPCGEGKFVMYAVVSLWLNALKFSTAIQDRELTRQLTARFEPFFGEKASKCSPCNHVDFSVFGSVPLRIAQINGDERARQLGLSYADGQWEAPDAAHPGDNGNAPYETQLEYLSRGLSPQSRFWIEDTYMMTTLQSEAWRLTGDLAYLDRMAREMALYLDRMQQPDGLFNHAADAPFHWGRGNGWAAGGMSDMLSVLPVTHPSYASIKAHYVRMMEALLSYQHDSGLWGQLIDGEAWDESSCSAMFTYAFIRGVKAGLLPAEPYLPAACKAWNALCAKIDAYGNVGGVGAGINCGKSRDFYLACPRVNGAPHGQAAMLWCCAALSEPSSPNALTSTLPVL